MFIYSMYTYVVSIYWRVMCSYSIVRALAWRMQLLEQIGQAFYSSQISINGSKND